MDADAYVASRLLALPFSASLSLLQPASAFFAFAFVSTFVMIPFPFEALFWLSLQDYLAGSFEVLSAFVAFLYCFPVCMYACTYTVLVYLFIIQIGAYSDSILISGLIPSLYWIPWLP